MGVRGQASLFAQGPAGKLEAEREGWEQVTLFVENGSPPDLHDRSRRAGWLLLAATLVATLAMSMLPAPYVIDQPGPTYDALGEVTVGEETVSLITAGSEEYPVSSELRITTVTRLGNPESLPSWWAVLEAWLSRQKSVQPVDSAFPPGVSFEEGREAARIDMENSQQEAIAAALTALGIPYSSHLEVVAVVEGGASEGVLEAGDILRVASGEQLQDVTRLRELIRLNGAQQGLPLVVDRDGRELTLEVIPRIEDNPEQPVIGVLVAGRYDFPVDVSIELENVGGPSAGLVFALGVMEKLTPEQEIPDGVFAGSGTITASGDVGAVGGIQHKAFGASAAGATVFLVPRDNCQALGGLQIEGMAIVPVSTLDEALEVFDLIESGQTLPSCSG